MMIQRDQKKHAANLENFEQALGSVRRDRESMRTEVQTLSTQLNEALNQVGNLTQELGETRRMIPSVPATQPPVMPQMIPPATRFPSYVMSSPPMEIPPRRIPEEAASERLSTYLEDQSSIAGFSMEPLGSTENDVRTADWISEHASLDGSRRSGSAAVSPPLGRVECGMPEGCGTEGSPVRFKIDLKPKDPPVFAGKVTDDVDIWVKQVSNFLTIIGGPDHIQVAYVANLLQGAAQHWFQRECDAGRHPRTWRELGQALRHRFGNDTKTEQAQSQIMSMQQGKNETAHDYALRFETVLEKIPQYEESWVRNLFVWGLHSHLATQVNMQNPATLNRAIQLAKKADVAIQLSRRPGASGSSSSQQQKTKAAGAKTNTVNAGHSRGSFYTGQNQKANKNFYYRGAYSGRTTRGGFRPQVTQTAPPPPRVVPINPGPQRGGGPGPRRGGRGNQRRPRAAGVRAIPEDTVMEQEVMAGQQGQGSGQQPERKGTTVSPSQRKGN